MSPAAKKRPASKRRAASVATSDTVLVLRTCDANMTSWGGFVWPRAGNVSAPDWRPEAVCGFGLHGLLWGEGDGSLLDWSEDAVWLVVEVKAADIVDLKGKIKFPRGVVLFAGKADEAVKYLQERAPAGNAIVGGTATAGDGGTATAGYRGTISIRYWDPKAQRYRVAIGYVGEDGIEPATAYVVDEAGKLAKKPVTP